MTDVLSLVPLGLAAGSLSFTISRSEMPLVQGARQWAFRKSSFLKALLHCPYCTSHYVAAALALIYRPRVVVSQWLWLDLAVTWMAIVGAAMVPIFMLLFIARQD